MATRRRSNAKELVTQAIFSQTQKQVQEFNRKIHDLMTLLEKNRENLSTTTSFYKTVNNIWVYTKANKETDIISGLLENQIMIALSSKDSWIEIQFLNDVFHTLQTGWVQKCFLEAVEVQTQPNYPSSKENQIIAHFLGES